MKYFFDNMISPKIVRALEALGVEATPLRAHFAENTSDVEFLRQLAGSAHVYVTADRRQNTRCEEAKALFESGMTTLFLGPFWCRLSMWSQASWMVKHWPTIDGYAKGAASGSVAELKQNGRALNISR